MELAWSCMRGVTTDKCSQALFRLLLKLLHARKWLQGCTAHCMLRGCARRLHHHAGQFWLRRWR